MFLISLLFKTLVVFGFAQGESPAPLLMLEGGLVWQQQNDARIPPNTGTTTEIDRFNPGPFPHARVEGFWYLNENSGLRAMVAPFSVTVSGRTEEPVVFAGETFSNQEDIDFAYTFNSYRLTYFHRLTDPSAKHHWTLGFTGKIRQAEVEYTQGDRTAKFDNLGFVPLLYVDYMTAISPDWFFNANLDFSAAPQGRAIDLALKLRHGNWGMGWRTIEGGADVDDVYTFSWFNYLVVDYLVVF